MNAAAYGRLALHEAAHGLVAVRLGVEVGHMRLYPARGYGETWTRDLDPMVDATVCMAGPVATPWNTSSHDVNAALELVGEQGMRLAARRAEALLRGQGAALDALREALLACDGDMLDGATATALVRSMVHDEGPGR